MTGKPARGVDANGDGSLGMPVNRAYDGKFTDLGDQIACPHLDSASGSMSFKSGHVVRRLSKPSAPLEMKCL
jgi:hypothetical protein